MPQEMPRVKTTLSRKAFLDAITAVDASLTREAAGVFWAQHAFETTRGANCWNFNFGNVKLGSASADWFDLPGTWEMVNGQRVEYPYGSNARKFRSFPDKESGAQFYMGFLKKYYPEAYQEALNGNPETFVEKLRDRGYFTGPLAAYKSNVVALWHEFMNATDPPPMGDELGKGSGGTVAPSVDVRADAPSGDVSGGILKLGLVGGVIWGVMKWIESCHK